MWDETLLVFSSDNGGQADLEYGGGSNFPLRGSTGSWWEGGMRVAAFVSGGYVPPGARGTVYDGMVHIADWATTLCGLAGGDSVACAADPSAAAAGLPPVDGLDLWPALSGANATSPRTAFAASTGTYMTTQWKLLLGDVSFASWTGPLFPNSSSGVDDLKKYTAACGTAGCLYNMLEGERLRYNTVLLCFVSHTFSPFFCCLRLYRAG